MTKTIKIHNVIESLENGLKTIYNSIMDDFVDITAPGSYILIVFPQVGESILVDLLMPDEIKKMFFKYVRNCVLFELGEIKNILTNIQSMSSALNMTKDTLEFTIEIQSDVMLQRVPEEVKQKFVSLCGVFLHSKAKLYSQHIGTMAAQCQAGSFVRMLSGLNNGSLEQMEKRLKFVHMYLQAPSSFLSL